MNKLYKIIYHTPDGVEHHMYIPAENEDEAWRKAIDEDGNDIFQCAVMEVKA